MPQLSIANDCQAGAIITSRIIMILAAVIISQDNYNVVWPCAKIESTLANRSTLLSSYPDCAAYVDGSDPDQLAIVKANIGGDGPANAGAALNTAFGMALWLAVVIHAIGVEVYVSNTNFRTFEYRTNIWQLHLTPREANRLRQVSYQRQLEAGMRNPGSAGLTSDRLGDADKWIPGEKLRAESSATSTSAAPFVERDVQETTQTQ
jgi:hypothetical protein